MVASYKNVKRLQKLLEI